MSLAQAAIAWTVACTGKSLAATRWVGRSGRRSMTSILGDMGVHLRPWEFARVLSFWRIGSVEKRLLEDTGPSRVLGVGVGISIITSERKFESSAWCMCAAVFSPLITRSSKSAELAVEISSRIRHQSEGQPHFGTSSDFVKSPSFSRLCLLLVNNCCVCSEVHCSRKVLRSSVECSADLRTWANSSALPPGGGCASGVTSDGIIDLRLSSFVNY